MHYWTNEAAGLYVPITYSFWGMLATVAHRDGAMNPAIFHAASVVLHVVCVLVVFLIVRQVTANELAACIAAMLFALHPVQVETVAWASGAKDLLGALFSLIAVDQYVRYVRASSQSPSRVRHYTMAVTALVVAMLAKPIAVVVPVIAVLLDVGFVRYDLRAALKSSWPMLVLVVPCIAWSRAVQNVWEQTVTPIWTRPLIAGDALAFYLYKLVWPISLTSFYGRTPQAVLGTTLVYVMWAVPLAVGAAAALSRKRPELLACLGIFMVALLPVLGLTPFEYQLHSTVADHYLYLPMLGIALAAAVGVSLRPNRPVIMASILVLALLDWRTMLQLRHWRDDLAWASHGAKSHPDNFNARASLGAALGSRGRIDEAIPHLRFCAERAPRSALAQMRLAQALVFANRFDEALPYAQAALELAIAGGASDVAWEHFLLGRALQGVGRTDEGQRHLDIAARLRPSLASPAATQ
jgi:hypothetical protein